MNRFFITLVVLSTLLLTVACPSLAIDEFGNRTVFTTVDQVVPGGEYAEIPVSELPEAIQRFFPNDEVIVLSGEEFLVEGASYVPIGGPQNEETVSNVLLEVGKVFLPGLAAWEGVFTLFSRRKRRHYTKAVKSAVPLDGKVDLLGAVHSLASAVGISHTSEATKAVAEGTAPSDLPEELLTESA
jgi:hypothetical protein